MMPRFRFTLQRMMLAIAIGAVVEISVVRWAVANATEIVGAEVNREAFIAWGAIHVSAAFIGLLIWIAYAPGRGPDAPKPLDPEEPKRGP